MNSITVLKIYAFSVDSMKKNILQRDNIFEENMVDKLKKGDQEVNVGR